MLGICAVDMRNGIMEKMPSESKPLLSAQTEKPNHYSYLKEFRVEQCSLFLQHKCTQHRPFTCFHWHFMNQRRRRPIRKRDGSFNYSADNYCTKYDETTGICPDGDDCPLLHRTAGDTERRYHLRYYKTCMCVHDTDARGFCVKNGAHCAFGHGNHDLRPPVYDIKEMQGNGDNPEDDGAPDGPNVLDKERNLMNEDPKWQDTNYVLSSYKTEQCKRPPRLCRQGYACPQFHNSRDKRRSPRKYKYRSTPCPNVKHGDEWGEPSNCESGDSCSYCHTRTEQQFHPEIYKSTKCNDVQTAGYCPRGVFCAFAHVDQEMSIARELAAPYELGPGPTFSEILTSALPTIRKRNKKSSESSNGSGGDTSECASTSSIGSNGSHSRAPGSQLTHNRIENKINTNFNNHTTAQEMNHRDLLEQYISLEAEKRQQESLYGYGALGLAAAHQPTLSGSSLLAFSALQYDGIEVIGGGGGDDLLLDDPANVVGAIERDLADTESTISSSISAGLVTSALLSSSAPVNIPRGSGRSSCLSSFSPTQASPLHHLQSGYLSASRFSHPDPIESVLLSQVGSASSKLGSLTNNSLYDYGMSPSGRVTLAGSPMVPAYPVSPSLTSPSMPEVVRTREEASGGRVCNLSSCEEKVTQALELYETLQREAEEANRKATIAEQQRDQAMTQAKALQKEVDLLEGSPYLHGLRRVSELRSLPLTTLKAIQAQLRSDLEQVDKELYLQTATKCMVCEERNRTVTLGPCNHYVLCSTCAPRQKDCPYCLTPIIAHTTPTTTPLHA